MTDDAAERSETMNEKTLKTHELANSQKPYHTVKPDS